MVKINVDPVDTVDKYCVDCKWYEPQWGQCWQDPKNPTPVDWFDTCNKWKELKEEKKGEK